MKEQHLTHHPLSLWISCRTRTARGIIAISIMLPREKQLYLWRFWVSDNVPFLALFVLPQQLYCPGPKICEQLAYRTVHSSLALFLASCVPVPYELMLYFVLGTHRRIAAKGLWRRLLIKLTSGVKSQNRSIPSVPRFCLELNTKLLTRFPDCSSSGVCAHKQNTSQTS